MSEDYELFRCLKEMPKRAREVDLKVRDALMKSNESFCSRLLYVLFLFLFLGVAKSNAQSTTLINPATDGGFEMGSTFEANGWTVLNDQLDQWFVGSVAKPSTGTKCAYISNNGGVSYAYTTAVGNGLPITSYFYKDIDLTTVPDQTSINLSFKWKNLGRDGGTGDRIQVFATPIDYIPPFGMGSSTTSMPQAYELTNTQSSFLVKQPEYVIENYCVPKSWAGKKFRLIFEYRVSTVANNQTQPAAIDDISLVSKVPTTVTSIASGNWNNPAIWSPAGVPQNQNVVIAAGHTVKIDTDAGVGSSFITDLFTGAACANNLTVNGVLTFGENYKDPTSVGATLQVFGDLVVNPGGVFNAYYNGVLAPTSKLYKLFSVGGNLTNNGTMDIYGAVMFLIGNGVQTIGGTGVFANSDKLSPAPDFTSTMYVRDLKLRNYNSAIPNINWGFDTKIVSSLELKQSRINLGSKVMSLGFMGMSTAPSQKMGQTDDAGFMPGSKFVRYWSATETGASITASTELAQSSNGKYPFIDAKGANRSLYISRAGTNAVSGAVAGEIGVVYNDASTITTGLTVVDGSTTITNRFDGNWVLSDSGTGTTISTLAIQAPGALGPIVNASAQTTPVRVMNATSVVGTHLNGTSLPTGYRQNLTVGQLTAGPFYIGASSSDLPLATTVKSVKSGNWNSADTWSTNAVPSATDNVSISAGNTVTVNTIGNVCKNFNIDKTGTLVQASGDLTIGVTLNNSVFTNSGTLSVTGGKLYINGSSEHKLGSTFIQNAGEIIVDGNNNNDAATSVPTFVSVMRITANAAANLQWTGGKIIFVDPLVSSNVVDYTLVVDQWGEYNSANAAHIVQFGDGVSTTPGGTTNNTPVTSDGFRFALKTGTSAATFFRLGTLKINAGNPSNTIVNRRVRYGTGTSITDAFGLQGDLLIDSGELYLKDSSRFSIMGNIVNNGVLITQGDILLGMASYIFDPVSSSGGGRNSIVDIACPNPQSISGSGKFLNTTGVVPSSMFGVNTMHGLSVNNSSAQGVTLNVPLSITQSTTNGTLFLQQGKINTTSTNILTLGMPGFIGTLGDPSSKNAYINGPFQRYISAGNPITTYFKFPVGKTNYRPFQIAPSTLAGTVNLVKVEAFETNSGTTDASCSNLAPTRWEVITSPSTPTFGAANVKLGDDAITTGNIPVQSSSANGVYSAAFGSPSIFTTGTPNIIQSKTANVVKSYFSYASLPTCSGAPVVGNAFAYGTENTIEVGNDISFTLSLPQRVASAGLTYIWESSTDNVTFTPINGLGSTPEVVTKQTVAVAYYRCKVSCGANTTISGIVTVTTPAAPTVTYNGSICAGTNTKITFAVTPTANIVYYLYDAPTGGNVVSYVDTNVTSTNDLATPVLNNTTTLYASYTRSGNNSTYGNVSFRTPVTIQVSPIPTAPTAVAQSFCNQGTVADLKTTSGTNIKWYNVATGGTTLALTAPLTTGTYYASQNPNGCESTGRTAVAVTVVAAPASATPQGFCNSGKVSDLVATGTNVKWYSAAVGGIQFNDNDALFANTIYYASQTDAVCGETSRTAVTVNIRTVAPDAPTGNSIQTFCNSATVANLSATGDTGAVIKWYDAAIAGNLLASTASLTTGKYYASQIVDGCESITRFEVTVTVNVVLAPTASAIQNFCAVTKVNQLVATANPTTAGATFKYYQVETGGTAISAPTTTNIVNGTIYYISQTISGCEGIARAAVTPYSVTVPVVSSPSPSPNFCNSATVADLKVNAAGTVKWYTAANPTTPMLPTEPIPVGTNSLSVTQTLSGCESAKTVVSVSVYNQALAAPTVSSAQKFATGSTIANIVATPTGTPLGGTYKWYDAPTLGNLLPSTTLLVNGTSYYASYVYNACESAGRTGYVASVLAPPSPPVAASPQYFTSTATVASLVPAPSVTIKWYNTIIGGSPLSSTAVLATGVSYYYVSFIDPNNIESITRTPVLVYANSVVTPVPTATTPQLFCGAGPYTVANLTANAINGATINWYIAQTGGSALASTSPVTTNTTYYCSQLYQGQESTRIAVDVKVSSAASLGAPAATSPQNFCSSASVANLVATTTTNPASNAVIQWYDADAPGGNLLSPTTMLSSGSYYAAQSDGCSSTARVLVVVTLSPVVPAPTAVNPQIYCKGATVASLQATGTGTIKWYTSPVGGTASLSTDVLPSTTNAAANTPYYASNTVGGCESSQRTLVTATVPGPLSPSSVPNNQTFCGVVTFANLDTANDQINWYDALTGGTLKSPTDILVSGDYYAAQVVSGCDTGTRRKVTVTVKAISTAPTASAAQTTCGNTVADLVANGITGVVNWYANSTGGTVLGSTDLISSGTYYASQVETNKCESSRTGYDFVVSIKPTPTVGAIVHPTCSVDTGSVTLNDLPSGSWTINSGANTFTGSTSSYTINGLTPGTKNITVVNSANCSSSNISVFINLKPSIPIAPIATVTQNVDCSNPTGSVTLSGLPTSGVWEINPGNITGKGDTKDISGLIAGNSSFTVTNAAGCISAPVNVTITKYPATPTIALITNPTCTSLGSVDLSGLPSTENWTILQTGTVSKSYTGIGSTTTISNLTEGIYYFTVSLAGGCTSFQTSAVVINPAPVVLGTPTVGTITQPTCGALGSVLLSGLPSGDWIITQSGTFPKTYNGVGSTTTISNLATGTYNFTVYATGLCTSLQTTAVVINQGPMVLDTPTVGTITQPTCSIALGSVILSGLPSTGDWTITQTGTIGKIYTGTGSTETISGLAAGTYNFTVSATGICTSLGTTAVVINAQPQTPDVILITNVIQTACSTQGAVTLSGLPSGNWTVTQEGAVEKTYTGSTSTYNVSGLVPGTFGFKVTNEGGCTSVLSQQVTINSAPQVLATPTVGTIAQPTCLALGSVALSNLPSSGDWTIVQSGTKSETYPGSGFTFNVIGLTKGTYTFVVTSSGSCNSLSSTVVTINDLPNVPAPTGDATQTFNQGATVGDIIVDKAPNGTINWYKTEADALAGTDELSLSATLVSNNYYAVQEIDGCTSVPFVVNVNITLGVNQFDMTGLRYYPNPVKGELNIFYNHEMSSIELFNLLGQNIMTVRPNAVNAKIDMTDLPIGTYLLQVSSEGKSAMIKVVKNQ